MEFTVISCNIKLKIQWFLHCQEDRTERLSGFFFPFQSGYQKGYGSQLYTYKIQLKYSVREFLYLPSCCHTPHHHNSTDYADAFVLRHCTGQLLSDHYVHVILQTSEGGKKNKQDLDVEKLHYKAFTGTRKHR